MRKYIYRILILSMLSMILIEKMNLDLELKQISTEHIVFRAHELDDKLVKELKNVPEEERGNIVGDYLLTHMLSKRFKKEYIVRLGSENLMENYYAWCQKIWQDIKYFPIPKSLTHKNYTVNYVNSWNAERTFGGKRGHEGTDLMASENTSGLYPVISMTDGIVTHKGWLELGGWRIGITTPSGVYYYYAHLASYADVEVGDQIEAGDIIGYMGNSGYGEEGTTGRFATHLHLGIYIYPDGKELSINPYWILKMIEEKKLFCSF